MKKHPLKDPLWVMTLSVVLLYFIGLKLYRDRQASYVSYTIECPNQESFSSTRAGMESDGELFYYNKSGTKESVAENCSITAFSSKTKESKVYKCDKDCKDKLKKEADERAKNAWNLFWSSP